MKTKKTKTKTIAKNKNDKPRVAFYLGVVATVASEASQVMAQSWHAETHPDAAHRARHHKIWQNITIGSVGLLAALFMGVGGVFAFAGGSLAPIYLGSAKIEATESNESIATKIEKHAKDYKFIIQYPDKSQKSFSIKDAGLSLDKQKSVQEAKLALKGSFVERLKWWEPIYLPVAVQRDQAKLQRFIDTHATIIKTPPQNAGLSIAEGAVVLTPEVVGEGFVIKRASESIRASVSQMTKKPLELKASKITPAILSKDTGPAKSKAEALLKQSVVFGIAGDSYTASPANIGAWIDVTPVPESKTFDVTVNSGRVLEYINGIAEDYVSPVSNRTVINTDSGQIVVDEGSDGSDVVNKDKVAVQVTDQLSKNQAVNAELKVDYVKAKTTALPAHAKWILANVTTKRMYAYEGSTLVRTFLVSAGAPDTPTVLGRYKVYAKVRSQDMRGLNTDGSRYFQPDVPYVLYFYGSYAIHGNYWRSASWFGNVNSSHGCVGVTVDDGSWIFNWAPIGTPVITQS